MRELRARGFPASKERGERLMREHGLPARHQRRDQGTTDLKPGRPVADKLLDRNITAPNPVWTSDITYFWTDEGGLCLTIVLDLFNREVVGWSLKPHRTADIATDALTLAWFRKRPAPGLLHPSDRGSQSASTPPGPAPGMRHDRLEEPEGPLPGKQAKRRFAIRQARGRSRTTRRPKAGSAASRTSGCRAFPSPAMPT